MCGLFLSLAGSGQVPGDPAHKDTIRYTASSIRFRVGFNVGYEAINDRKAYSTVSTPVGVDLRFYTNPFRFWQLGVSGMHMIINDSLFTLFLKSDVSYHVVRPFYTISAGIIYNQTLFNHGQMLGLQYGYETQRIPYVFSYMYSFKYNTHYFLIGLSIPIFKTKVFRERTFTGNLSRFR